MRNAVHAAVRSAGVGGDADDGCGPLLDGETGNVDWHACRASLGAEVPRYTFEVRVALEGETDDVDVDGTLLGTLTYPE